MLYIEPPCAPRFKIADGPKDFQSPGHATGPVQTADLSLSGELSCEGLEAFVDKIPIVLAVCGGVAGIGYGLAAVIRAWFDGKSKLLRAERGDPELPAGRPALLKLLGKSPNADADQ